MKIKMNVLAHPAKSETGVSILVDRDRSIMTKIKNRKVVDHMAVLKNMKYGIISRQEEFLLLKKLGVPERNIYSLESFEVLARQLQAGDTVMVKSVRGCFPSMHQFYAFLLRLQKLGVEFISKQEKYLCNTFRRPLSAATMQLLYDISARELKCIQEIPVETQADRKMYLTMLISQANVLNIADMFANDGIKRRGN